MPLITLISPVYLTCSFSSQVHELVDEVVWEEHCTGHAADADLDIKVRQSRYGTAQGPQVLQVASLEAAGDMAAPCIALLDAHYPTAPLPAPASCAGCCIIPRATCHVPASPSFPLLKR